VTGYCADTETRRRVWKHESCLVGMQDSYHRSLPPFLACRVRVESTRYVFCAQPGGLNRTAQKKNARFEVVKRASRESCPAVVGRKRVARSDSGVVRVAVHFEGGATWRSLGCALAFGKSVFRVRLPLIRPLCCETLCTCAILLFFRVSVSRVASDFFQGYSRFLLHSWFGCRGILLSVGCCRHRVAFSWFLVGGR
jgi:hypothetical protein